MPSPRKNPAAVQLGKLAAGKPKHYTEEEIQRRRDRLTQARKNRWPAKPAL